MSEVYALDVADAGSERFYELVGMKIRSARIAAGVSQATLATRVGLTRSSVANLEAARQHVSLYHFINIRKALNVPISVLLPDMELPSKAAVSADLQIELADSPETTKEFVRGAVERLRANSDSGEV